MYWYDRIPFISNRRLLCRGLGFTRSSDDLEFCLILPIAIVTGIGAWFGYTPRPVVPKPEWEDVHLRIIYLYDVLNNIDDTKFNGGPGPSFEDWLNNRIWIESYERRNRRKRVVEWKGFYITQLGQEHIFVRTEPQS